MPDKYNQTLTDHDGETSSFGFAVANITAANFDAQAALELAFYSASLDLTLGEVRETSVKLSGVTNRNVPANKAAQRELKYLVTMLDGTVDKFFQFELPTADTGLLPDNGSYLVKNAAIQGADGGGEIAAFVAATEAYYQSPYGNAANVWAIELVGRNI